MPAIQLERLEKQIAALRDALEEPHSLVRQLRELFAFYSDPARRAGQSGMPAPLLSAYHTPPQVVRMVTRRLSAWVQEAPAAGLALSDALWETANLECRRVAAGVLGSLPIRAEEAVLQRLETWLEETPEVTFRGEIVALATRRLRTESPQTFARWVEEGLHAKDARTRLTALQAVRHWLDDPDFDNLPLVFRWLRLLSGNLSSSLRPEFAETLQILARRSPQETAYFLRSLVLAHNTPRMRLLVRRVLPSLPDAWRGEVVGDREN